MEYAYAYDSRNGVQVMQKKMTTIFNASNQYAIYKQGIGVTISQILITVY
jgi:hypothetical protein